MYIHIYIHIDTHTCTYIHIHTHTYTLLYFTLHYVSLHYITPHYITLHYTDGLEVRMSCFPPNFFLWKLEWRTQMDVEILLKFYLSVRIMLVNVDKNVQKLFDQTCLPVVPGSPNLYRFVGLECLRSICLQNLWILYRFEIYVYIIYIYI